MKNGGINAHAKERPEGRDWGVAAAVLGEPVWASFAEKQGIYREFDRVSPRNGLELRRSRSESNGLEVISLFFRNRESVDVEQGS